MPESLNTWLQRNRILAAAAAGTLVSMLLLLIYQPALHGAFVFDDLEQIVVNAKIRSLDGFRMPSRWLNPQERTLSFFTLALNFQWFGLEPLSYHLSNLFLHLLFGMATLAFVRLMLTAVRPNQRSSWAIPLFVALLVLLHPIQTQAVSYTIQRMTLLSGLFYVSACFFYLWARLAFIKRGWNRKLLFAILAVVACTFLALNAKQNAASLPIAWWLLEGLVIKNKQGKANRSLLIAIPLCCTIVAMGLLLSPNFVTKDSTLISRSTYLITQFGALWFYARLLLLPVGQNVDHDFPMTETLLEWPSFLALPGLLVVIALAVLFRKQNPFLAIGLAWIAVTLSVESSVIPIRDVVAEHRLYLALPGFALVLASLSSWLGRWQLSAACLLLGAYALLTYQRNQVWAGPTELWTDAATKSPEKARPQLGLAYALFEENNLEGARAALEKALSLDPNNPKALNIMGMIHFRQGDREQAIHRYNAALNINPKQAGVHNNIGLAWEALNEPREAFVHFRKAVVLEAGNATYLYNAGNALLAQSKYEAAISIYEKATQLDPAFAKAWSNLGMAHARSKNYQKATQALQNAVSFDPSSVDSWNNLGSLWIIQSDTVQAVNCYQKALDLDPHHQESLENFQRFAPDNTSQM